MGDLVGGFLLTNRKAEVGRRGVHTEACWGPWSWGPVGSVGSESVLETGWAGRWRRSPGFVPEGPWAESGGGPAGRVCRGAFAAPLTG